MKIVFRREEMASYYIYKGLASAFAKLGHTCVMWNPANESPFDAFNRYKPDLFIGQGYNLDRATIKCLNNNSNIKILLKVGAGSKNFRSVYDEKRFQVLMATDLEKSLVNAITHKDRLTLFNYCHSSKAEFVIGEWKDLGYNIYGLLPSADTDAFPANTQPNDKFKSDIVIVGGYWSYKAVNIDSYILPLCYPIGKYNIKIFGNQKWPVPHFAGQISNELAPVMIASSTITPSIHEPHSNEYGFDLLPRTLNAIACNGFVISDYVEDYRLILAEDELPMFKTASEYLDAIDYFVKNPDKRLTYMEKAKKTILESCTVEHRTNEILSLVR